MEAEILGESSSTQAVPWPELRNEDDNNPVYFLYPNNTKSVLLKSKSKNNEDENKLNKV